MKREEVFITGAAGLLGSHLVERLSKQKYKITAMVKPNHDTSFLRKFSGVKVFSGDLKKPETFINHIPKKAIIIHNYALSPAANASKDVYFKENILSASNVFKGAAQKKAKQLVYISSCSVVGPRAKKNRFISEDENPKPDTDYGWSKLKAEGIVHKFYKKTGIPCLMLRVFPLYGPRSHVNSTPVKFYKMVKKRYFIFVGNGGNPYEFCYAGNAADAIILAFQKIKDGIEVLNIAEPEKRTFKEIIDEISKYANPKVKHIYIPKYIAYPIGLVGEVVALSLKKRLLFRLRALRGMLGAWNADCSKLVDVLGYKQQYSLEEGVEVMAKWMEKEKMWEKKWEK